MEVVALQALKASKLNQVTVTLTTRDMISNNGNNFDLVLWRKNVSKQRKLWEIWSFIPDRQLYQLLLLKSVTVFCIGWE